MPTWDQTLVFENIQLFENPQKLLKNPPHVVIEIFDEDTIVCTYFFSILPISGNRSTLCFQAKDDFLGRVTAPVDPSGAKPFLRWYPVMYIGEQQGELLGAFQLIATSDNPVVSEQQ